MFDKNEKGLIFIIRYAPLMLIVLISFLVTVAIEHSNNLQFEEEKNRLTNFYTSFNKQELKEEIYRAYNYILKEDENSKENLKIFLKEKVYQAHSIASRIYEDNKDVKSKDEILKLIKSALGSIIYNNGRGYYFINNIEGVNILQPLNRKIEDTNILELEDVNGYKFIKTIVQSIKDKTEKFDTYYWYKNDKDKTPYEKISFYKFFEPLNISIGTGEYVVDFEEEIKHKVINNIQNIELDDGGYIFLFDFSGTILAHKNRDNIGKNFINIEDTDGKKIVQEFIKIAKNKEGFISYYNTTLNVDAYKKTSFIKGYEKWNWLIGFGYSDEELLEIISDVKKELIKKNKESYDQIIIISFFVTLFLLLLSLLISVYLENIFKKYRSKIKEEEKNFRNLFEYSNIGLAIADKQGKLLEINSKFTEILAYKEEELKQKYIGEISKDLVYDIESNFTIETVFIKSNGENIDILLTANVLKVDNYIKNILFSIIDITEINDKNRLLAQQSKMASMGEMLANIAHQWRQPLSSISTISSGMKLEKEYGILDNDKLNNNLDLITESTKYLSETINDFMNFFKPQESVKKFHIKKLIEKSLRLVSNNNLDIKFIKDIEDIEIESFENDLIQILINIINNAVDALKEIKSEKYIFISTSLSKDNMLEITIKDNGGGIDDLLIDKIFEPYFTTKHKQNGTGIGLYMVTQIIQKHAKGNISVENINYEYNENSYKGACFKIILPLVNKG